MNREEVVKALETTSPEFITAYERKFTNEASLKNMLAEHSKLTTDLRRSARIGTMLAIGGLSILIGMSVIVDRSHVLPAIALMLSWFFVIAGFIFWDQRRRNEKFTRLDIVSTHLESFRGAVDALDPLVTNLRKDRRVVMAHAVILARDILSNQGAFYRGRIDPKYSVAEVSSLATAVIDSERKFESFWSAVGKFDAIKPADFNKQKIFAMAEARLRYVRSQPLDEDEVPPRAVMNFADKELDNAVERIIADRSPSP